MRRSPSISTGTTGLDPIYPMIPHIRVSPVSARLTRTLLPGLCRSLALDPAFDIPLLAGADRQRPRRHVFPEGRACPDVGAAAHRQRRDQLRIAADEGPILDDGLMLLLAVVVAGDRACPDVDVGPNRRVAKVGEVVGLGAGSHGGL